MHLKKLTRPWRWALVMALGLLLALAREARRPAAAPACHGPDCFPERVPAGALR